MDPFDALDRARAESERRLDAIGDDQWDLPTPCTEMTVRGVVSHLSAGNRMAVLLLAGTGRDEVLAEVRKLHRPDPDWTPARAVAEFRASADAQGAALREPGALDRTCHHVVGDVPGAQLLRFRTGDMTLHAWDLARGIGADETLDPELAEHVYTAMAPMASFIATTGMFGSGPSGAVDDGAPVQVRLLDLSGRRP